MDEVDSGTWESEAGSPNYDQLDEPSNDPLETSTNTSPSPRMVQSHLKLLLVESNGSQGDTEVGNGELKIQTQTEAKDIPLVIPASSRESLSTTSAVTQPTVVLPRHIPVVQVSSYQSTMRRVASEPTRSISKPGFLRTSSAAGQSHGRKLCITTTPVKTEINLSPSRERSETPGSKEMLAANVLSGRFYQDETYA